MILSLIKKEILVMLKDTKARIAIILPPLVQLFIFAFAATLDVKNATIGVINRDNGDKSFELLQRFHGAPLFKEIIYLKSMEEVGTFMDEQKGLLVVSIDEQFSREEPATVQLICDGRKSNTTQILAGYATSIIQSYQGIVDVVPRTWFNPNILYLWYNMPCLVSLLAMLTCLVVTSQSVAREREMGTFDQLLVSPLSPFQILVGKIVPGILIGGVEGILMWAISVFLFGVPFTGSFLLLLFSLFLFVTAISGIGIYISSISGTQQQALLGSFAFMLPSVLISGFATPIENMPGYLQQIAYLMPLRYMLVIAKGVFLKALPAHHVFMQLWPIVLISLFTLTLASYSFRRRLE